MPIEKILAFAVGCFWNALIREHEPAGHGKDLLLELGYFRFLFRIQIAAMLLFDLAIVICGTREECGRVELGNIFPGEIDRRTVLLWVALFAVLGFGRAFQTAIPTG